MDMDKNYDAFDDYAMKFNLEEDSNRYKYNHSYRVMKECENICKSLYLDEEDVYIAGLIGLLHDIARFYQWDNFKTFNDGKYFDHGDYAVKILFEENLIKEFDVEEEYYDIIKTAIKNHNKKEIDKTIDDESLIFFSKIVRDADKLDIFYAISSPNLLRFEESDDEISEEVKKDFFNHKLIDNNLCKTNNDKIIRTLSFIYDLNFDYSYKKILESKYLDLYYKNLKHKKIFKEYIDEAKIYLKERVK